MPCADCDAPYCYLRWNVTESGYGRVLSRGHGKSLDPHWS